MYEQYKGLATRLVQVTPHAMFTPEVADALAAAADSVFKTDELSDTTAIMNALLSCKDRGALIYTLSAAYGLLLERHLLAHPELSPEVEIRELAARIVTRMW